MNRAVAVALVALGGGLNASETNAQQRFHYPEPPSGAVHTSKDVAIGASGLFMDVYRPANASAAAPTIIFFNRATGAQRGNAFYASWARTAASKGLVAIVPDIRDASPAEDFQALVSHLASRGTELGVDRDAIAVYAGSGNVFNALPIVQDPRMTAIKAAVMYYGSAPVEQFRRDLPLLYVRAGLDRPGVNANIASLVARATVQNAPVTLLNHPIGHHAFEMVDDDAGTRDVIDRTIDFVKHAMSASYQAALRASIVEATAAAHVASGDFPAAATSYRTLVDAKPTDARLRLSLGEALLGAKQYGQACAEFELLKDKGLGPRDLGLPAARACLGSGDQDAAIGWLKSIPSRYLPRDIESDPAFASLRGRPDFRALFQSPD
jgi:dienelactone hydrolase